MTVQIVRDLKAALQYQITNEYNKTALPSNMTSLETNRVTAAWDIMQIEVCVMSEPARCYDINNAG